MKYHLWIIGCQYNEWDGARLRYFLDSLGLQESSVEEAGVVIIVACAVRQTAVDRILGRVKNWNHTDFAHRSGADKPKKSDKKLKANKLIPNKLVLVTGCVLGPDKKKFAEKGIEIFEPGDFGTLAALISDHGFQITRLGWTEPRSRRKSEMTEKKANKLTSNKLTSCSYVPIMTGCNNFCSYCAVPYTRGREKSRPINEIVGDVKSIIKYRSSLNGENFSPSRHGSKSKKIEIMLLGQNVNSYTISDRSVIPDLIGDPLIVDSRRSLPRILMRGGNDDSKLSDFTILLEMLNDLEGEFEISFTSNHPKDMTDDILEAVATLPKVKKEIHLPLQSGCDKVLQSMNRPYTIKQYLDIVDKIKKASDIDITTDVIVGYPTETEEDFEKTVEIFKKVKFKQAYINKYSPRAGTVAYKLGDPVPWAEKQRRWRVLSDIVFKKNSLTLNKKQTFSLKAETD